MAGLKHKKPAVAEKKPAKVHHDEPITKEKSIVKESVCNECTCPESLHYGSEKRWCNASGCQCQEFKA